MCDSNSMLPCRCTPTFATTTYDAHAEAERVGRLAMAREIREMGVRRGTDIALVESSVGAAARYEISIIRMRIDDMIEMITKEGRRG